MKSAKTKISGDPNDQQRLEDMYRMVKEIYHHLGLDVNRQTPASLSAKKREMEQDVLKWLEKRKLKKGKGIE